MKKDKIGVCPLTKQKESCYIVPLNELYNHYHSLSAGFQTSDLWKKGEFDFEELESTLPELYKVIKQVDDEGRVWYPIVNNLEEKGIVFVIGTSKEDWEWAGSLHTPVLEEEKERFKRPDGTYAKFKNDPQTLKRFGRVGYINALSYIGALE
jgi:hypothetical protein